MLKQLLSTTAIVLGVAGFVSTASAADLPMKPVKLVSYEKAKEFDGFYLRGDVGYAIPNSPGVQYGPSIKFVNEDLSNAWLVGAGIGYVFNHNFRTDLTVDYQFQSKFKGNTVCGLCTPGLSDERSKFTNITVLANAYYDIGSFNGFTPYLGLGAGMAQNKFSAWNSVNPGGSPASTVIRGDSKWNFAAAAMAGTSYAISSNLALDANYRFLWIGDGRTSLDSINYRVNIDDMYEHQFRLGLRYMFN